jgi:cytochrome c
MSGRTFPALLVVAMAAMTSPGSAFAQEPGAKEDDAGQVVFNTHCRNCHSTKPGDNRLGPSLNDIYGKPAGQVKGFGNYSGGLTADITWDDATLDKFITDPTAMVSNTTMKPFPGVADAEQRKLIIEFLKTQKPS